MCFYRKFFAVLALLGAALLDFSARAAGEDSSPDPVKGLSPLFQNNIRPLYSHNYLTLNGKEYSVWVIRPVMWTHPHNPVGNTPLNAFARNPKIPYEPDLKGMFGEISMSPKDAEFFWKEHEAQTKILLGHMRSSMREVYRAQGYYDTPEKTAQQEAVFDEVYDGYSSSVVITEKDNPKNGYQQISVIANKGFSEDLPIDRELKRNGELSLASQVATSKKMPEFIFNKEGPIFDPKQSRLSSQNVEGTPRFTRTWIAGGKVELKALMRNPNSPEDFMAVAFREVFAHDLLKFSWVPKPGMWNHAVNVPGQSETAFYEWTDTPLFYKGGREEQGFYLKRSIGWLAAPLYEPTVRNTDVYASTHSPAHRELYVRGFGFDKTPVRAFKDGDHNVEVVRADVSRFEEVTWEKARARKSSEGLKDAIITPAAKDIYGKDRHFVRLETFGEGERRRYLKLLRPKAAKLISEYQYEFDKKMNVEKSRLIEKFGAKLNFAPVAEGITCEGIFSHKAAFDLASPRYRLNEGFQYVYPAAIGW